MITRSCNGRSFIGFTPCLSYGVGDERPAQKSFRGLSTHPQRVLIIGAAQGYFKTARPDGLGVNTNYRSWDQALAAISLIRSSKGRWAHFSRVISSELATSLAKIAAIWRAKSGPSTMALSSSL